MLKKGNLQYYIIFVKNVSKKSVIMHVVDKDDFPEQPAGVQKPGGDHGHEGRGGAQHEAAHLAGGEHRAHQPAQVLES